MKVLGVIAARGGSKGVPLKNIRDLDGLPLIEYTINAGLASDIYRLIVSSDSEKIIDVATSLGVAAPFIRPFDLSSDTARSIDVAHHALVTCEELYSEVFDAVLLLQPTTPLRTAGDINQSIQLLKENPDADSVISVVDVQSHHPARMKYIRDGILIDPAFCEEYENQNRQELEPMYIRNGAIYLTRRNVILNRSFKGNRSLAFEMPISRSINIDTMDDFNFAEYLIRSRQ